MNTTLKDTDITGIFDPTLAIQEIPQTLYCSTKHLSSKLEEHPDIKEVIGLVGSGGQGKVFRTMTQINGIEQEVALKTFAPNSMTFQDSASFQEEDADHQYSLWKNEYLKLKQLTGIGGVRQVYDIEEDFEIPFYTLDYVKGRTLEDIIQIGDHLDDPQEFQKNIKHIVELLHTLEQVHQRDVVHRDIKPTNIIIEDETQRPFLIDFGVSRERKYIDPSSRISGSPAYMSERQLENKPAYPKDDLFSVGVILYKMVHPEGKTPLCAYKKEYDLSEAQMLRHLYASTHYHISRPQMDWHIIQQNAVRNLGATKGILLTVAIQKLITSPYQAKNFYHVADHLISDLEVLDEQRKMRQFPATMMGMYVKLRQRMTPGD